MKRILVLGAGRSATSLISYLLKNAAPQSWEVCVGDISKELALQKVQGYDYGSAIEFNIDDMGLAQKEIERSDLVISMLPARLHPKVARICVSQGRHLLTASYVSPEMMELHKEATAKGILLLNECGLDPGLDHMTAMAALDDVRAKDGAMIDSFKSFTGGLMAPDSDDNPWHYKFTWNPRNVVLAGKETAQFIRKGRYKYIPYHQLFTRLEMVEIDGFGSFEGYANRDSLKYRSLYRLQDISTMIRGTLRRPGFCETWNVFVQLGMTDDSYQLENLGNMSYRDFVNTFLYYHPSKSAEEKLCDYLKLDPEGAIMQKLIWAGIFSNDPIGLASGSPAQILQYLLESKWSLGPADKDMIVMQHQLGYSMNGTSKNMIMSLITIGDDKEHTAMSKTVGWPLGIVAKLVLTGVIQDKGVQVPVSKQYYQPVLKELDELGVQFIEKEFS